jgi:hypothetical protein
MLSYLAYADFIEGRDDVLDGTLILTAGRRKQFISERELLGENRAHAKSNVD